MKNWFLEEFIRGREFNLSLIGGKGGPVVLPPAEMQYVGYPENKPKILNFASKWDEESFEYHHTIRTFDLPAKDNALITEMTYICYHCQKIFELKGYARVDFRVDENNKPYVLEVNINPCLSPDAGFPAACQKAGMSYTEMIDHIIYDAFV
jgi:D-alanine-D-alanine ligase